MEEIKRDGGYPEIAWASVNKEQYDIIMDVARQNNLDHLIHVLPYDSGFYLKFKRQTLSDMMEYINDDKIKAILQECGNEIFGW